MPAKEGAWKARQPGCRAMFVATLQCHSHKAKLCLPGWAARPCRVRAGGRAAGPAGAPRAWGVRHGKHPRGQPPALGAGFARGCLRGGEGFSRAASAARARRAPCSRPAALGEGRRCHFCNDFRHLAILLVRPFRIEPMLPGRWALHPQRNTRTLQHDLPYMLLATPRHGTHGPLDVQVRCWVRSAATLLASLLVAPSNWSFIEACGCLFARTRGHVSSPAASAACTNECAHTSAADSVPRSGPRFGARGLATSAGGSGTDRG